MLYALHIQSTSKEQETAMMLTNYANGFVEALLSLHNPSHDSERSKGLVSVAIAHPGTISPVTYQGLLDRVGLVLQNRASDVPEYFELLDVIPEVVATATMDNLSTR
jgi:hypothetical protein